MATTIAPAPAGLSASRVRELISCHNCSELLQNPITTRCGLSYCRSCILPESSTNLVSSCPEDQCRRYSPGNCQIDIVMSNVTAILKTLLEKITPAENDDILSDVQFMLEDDDNLKCAICRVRLLDPVTTHCGHTYCAHCIRSLVESTELQNAILCPICRRPLDWPYQRGIVHHHDAAYKWSHNPLRNLIMHCWEPWVHERRQTVALEEILVPDGMQLPIFYCTISWPGQVTMLRVFEMRYRRMLRRIMQGETFIFGMVMRDPSYEGELSRVGTALKVQAVAHQGERAIYIKTVGMYRFRIKGAPRRWHGYWTAAIERIEDEDIGVDWDFRRSTPTMEQEAKLALYGFQPDSTTILAAIKLYQDDRNLVACLRNSEIMSLIRKYVDMRLEFSSAQEQAQAFEILRKPPEDNIDMLWWFAHVMGMRDEFAIRLLGSTNVRFRLEACLFYIVQHIPDHSIRLWD